MQKQILYQVRIAGPIQIRQMHKGQGDCKISLVQMCFDRALFLPQHLVCCLSWNSPIPLNALSEMTLLKKRWSPTFQVITWRSDLSFASKKCATNEEEDLDRWRCSQFSIVKTLRLQTRDCLLCAGLCADATDDQTKTLTQFLDYQEWINGEVAARCCVLRRCRVLLRNLGRQRDIPEGLQTHTISHQTASAGHQRFNSGLQRPNNNATHMFA